MQNQLRASGLEIHSEDNFFSWTFNWKSVVLGEFVSVAEMVFNINESLRAIGPHNDTCPFIIIRDNFSHIKH
jgi:hypothetical protein